MFNTLFIAVRSLTKSTFKKYCCYCMKSCHGNAATVPWREDKQKFHPNELFTESTNRSGQIVECFAVRQWHVVSQCSNPNLRANRIGPSPGKWLWVRWRTGEKTAIASRDIKNERGNSFRIINPPFSPLFVTIYWFSCGPVPHGLYVAVRCTPEEDLWQP